MQSLQLPREIMQKFFTKKKEKRKIETLYLIYI